MGPTFFLPSPAPTLGQARQLSREQAHLVTGRNGDRAYATFVASQHLNTPQRQRERERERGAQGQGEGAREIEKKDMRFCANT